MGSLILLIKFKEMTLGKLSITIEVQMHFPSIDPSHFVIFDAADSERKTAPG